MNTLDSVHLRETLLHRLSEDLLGPYAEDEVLSARPTDVYLTGILWPRDTRIGGHEDERLALSGSMEPGEGGDGGEEELPLSGFARPCSAGFSFAARSGADVAKVDVAVSFATYEPQAVREARDDAGPGSKMTHYRKEWRRRPHEIVLTAVPLRATSQLIDLRARGAPLGVKLHLRTVPWTRGTLATITLLNDADPDADEREQATLFQVRVEVRPAPDTVLVARPSRRATFDDGDRSADLLYRHAHEFATGHTCSAEWETDTDSNAAIVISTSWIPSTIVPATSASGHPLFDPLRGKNNTLSASHLASLRGQHLAKALAKLPAAYGKWLDIQEATITQVPDAFRDQAKSNIVACRATQRRMAEGATRIATDDQMSLAFRLANLAMDVQYGWGQDRSADTSQPDTTSEPLEWRPFQLGFILLAASSVSDRHSPDRHIMDLLWFPTGGGKTEAYLALVAFLAFYRRLSDRHNPDSQSGVAAIMRYTLRLLTTQQFVRAASVLLACEAIRRGQVPRADSHCRALGSTPFSIGLWVGNSATPNSVAVAARALTASGDQPTPKQLLNCPACRTALHWFHDEKTPAIHVRCDEQTCLLFDPKEPLPVWTVDEDLYRTKPTLLIATIDKFAQIARRKEIAGLFGLQTGNPPDLILQDELHLIAGPLGTIAGLYETAIDRMFTSGGTRPKVIGSTATIRRASEHVTSLFHRETAQFPPACLDADDSAFAVVDPAAPGRLYAGVTTAGRSAKFTLQAVAASLLQSAWGVTTDDDVRDPYWTLVSYFNSLRELGGALVMVQDDVHNSLATLARRRGEIAREPDFVEELTSRLTQAEVRDMLDRLATPAQGLAALDVVLATNMLSVGVDIPRLGLMLVNGQPKGMAEYIQATSRIGRGQVPGLVVSVLNNGKPRDRSHYEAFSTWHETLYRDVEATSVTPFASRARDRALHAVLVALVRQLVPGMLERPILSDATSDAVEELIQDIVDRAAAVDPQEGAVRAELERRLEAWRLRGPTSYWSFRADTSLLQDAERAAAKRALGRTPGAAWPTLNSMRDVEPSSSFRLVEGLSESPSKGGRHGS